MVCVQSFPDAGRRRIKWQPIHCRVQECGVCAFVCVCIHMWCVQLVCVCVCARACVCVCVCACTYNACVMNESMCQCTVCGFSRLSVQVHLSHMSAFTYHPLSTTHCVHCKL